jgi:hypothetical protein
MLAGRRLEQTAMVLSYHLVLECLDLIECLGILQVIGTITIVCLSAEGAAGASSRNGGLDQQVGP